MIPTNDNNICLWSDSFISQCAANKTARAIPTEAVSTARTLCDAYKTAHGIAQEPDTHSKAATTAKEALSNDLTVIVAKYVYNNDAITAPMRDNLGLPVKDTTRSSIPAPDESPEFFIKVKAIHTLDVYFKVAVGSPGRARPYGYNGAVISYGILDTPPMTRISCLIRCWQPRRPIRFCSQSLAVAGVPISH